MRAEPTLPMNIAFIGLGVMGRPMAASLQAAGHALRVHDIRRDAAEELIEGGAVWADQVWQAAYDAELVFTCLPGPAEVDAVAGGEHGLLEIMRPGAAWFDLTTNAPDRMRALHAAGAKRGVFVLDAPVSGGPQGAALRQLALWVGGDAEIYDRYEGLLRVMGDEPLYLGPIGAGTIAKLVHNCANFAVQSVLAEAFTLGVKAGLPPLALFKALRRGTTGRARTFDRLAEQFLPGEYEPPAFALRLALKDMKLVMELAGSSDVPMRHARAALDDFVAALGRGWGDKDARIALSLQEERAGVSVRIARDDLRAELGAAAPPPDQSANKSR